MSTNVTTTTQKPEAPKALTLRAELEGDAFKRALSEILPKHLTPDRIVRTAILAMTKNPKLAKCDKASFFRCMMDLSAMGLEADGRRAHLIPFKNRKKSSEAGVDVYECTLVVGYQGLAEMTYNSGKVATLHAAEVREGDHFVYSMGEVEDHVPHFLRRDKDKPETAGEVIAVYAIAKMKDGSRKCEVMSIEEINRIRDASQGFQAFKKYGNDTAWDPADPNAEGEMRKKTVFRRLAKWLPFSPEVREIIQREDESEHDRKAITIDTPSIASPALFEMPTSTETAEVCDNDGGAR